MTVGPGVGLFLMAVEGGHAAEIISGWYMVFYD